MMTHRVCGRKRQCRREKHDDKCSPQPGEDCREFAPVQDLYLAELAGVVDACAGHVKVELNHGRDLRIWAMPCQDSARYRHQNSLGTKFRTKRERERERNSLSVSLYLSLSLSLSLSEPSSSSCRILGCMALAALVMKRANVTNLRAGSEERHEHFDLESTGIDVFLCWDDFFLVSHDHAVLECPSELREDLLALDNAPVLICPY